MRGAVSVRTWCAGLGAVCLLLGHSPLGQDAHAEPAEARAVAPAAQPPVVPEPDARHSDQALLSGDETDVLKLADLDIEALSKVDVLKPTMTDPVVEAVSKAPEKASEAPGIVDVITAEDIQEFGAKNLYEVLEWATSVYMTGSFLYPRNIASIRGDLFKHEDNHVLLLINGRPFRDTTQGGVNVPLYTAFPIHMIERIEVIRGPGSVLYGTNAFTGVINVVTKDPKEPTLHASVLGGSHAWQSYSLATGNGNDARGYYAGAMYNRSEGWPFTATLEDMQTDTGLYGENNIGVFAMYRNGGLTAHLFVADPVSDMAGPAVVWPLEQLYARRVFVDFGYLWEFDQRRSLDLHFTYNYAGTEFAVDAPQHVGKTFIAPANSFLLEGTYRTELADGLKLMIGGVTDVHTGEAFTGPEVALPWFEEIWYSAYLQLDYQVNDRLKLVGGMQGNMPGVIPGGIVPRAGVIASLSENWTTKFLFGQAFRSPYQIERSISTPVIQGNPNLIPELAQTFDAQLAFHTDDYRLAATYFHSRYFDLIERVGIFPQTYINSTTPIEFQGVELENEWQLSERLRWLGSVTYQNNIGDGAHNVTYVPIWMAKMGLTYHNDRGLNVALMDVFYGTRSEPPTAAEVNPAPEEYHLATLNMRLDLNRRFHWRMNRQMDLQFMIQNLFNEPIYHAEFEREVINTLPAGPGRTFYGGFSMAY